MRCLPSGPVVSVQSRSVRIKITFCLNTFTCSQGLQIKGFSGAKGHMSVCSDTLMLLFQHELVYGQIMTHSEKAQKHKTTRQTCRKQLSETRTPRCPLALAISVFIYYFVLFICWFLSFSFSLLPRSRLAEVLMLCVFGRWTNPLFLCKPACKWTRVSPETLRSAGNSALHFAFLVFFFLNLLL